MALSRTAKRPGSSQNNHSWPGFVDALSTMLLVIIFLLSIFMLAQFFLGQALSNKENILDRLKAEIMVLKDSLIIQKKLNTDMSDEFSKISSDLQQANLSREQLTNRLSELELDLLETKARSKILEEERIKRLATVETLKQKNTRSATELNEQRALSAQSTRKIDLLNRQISNLQQQLVRLNNVLEASEARDKNQKVVIRNLTQRLNTALAAKVQELSQFRSEFFGRLKDLLGQRSDIRIRGDRFVFQAEVLFASGSANLGTKGQQELKKLAEALKNISRKIPGNINWVLRVDGHTDILPIRTQQFPSNWDLSAARALSVVKFLIASGIPPERLAAAGFGQFHPLDTTQTPDSYSRNRRIEMRLTQH